MNHCDALRPTGESPNFLRVAYKGGPNDRRFDQLEH